MDTEDVYKRQVVDLVEVVLIQEQVLEHHLVLIQNLVDHLLDLHHLLHQYIIQPFIHHLDIPEIMVLISGHQL